MHTYTLTGTITNQNNLPIPNVTITAHDQDPNTPETQLGKGVVTDALGQYAITYKDEDFIIEGRESGGADIVIRVYDAAGVLLGESERYEDAPRESVIDLQITYALPTIPVAPQVAPPSLRIKGSVVDRLGRNLKDAEVALWEENTNTHIATSALTDQSGSFEIVLQDDAFESAMACNLFFFKVHLGHKEVFDSYKDARDQDPITWDISHKAEDRIELTANITAKIVDTLYPKSKAIALRNQGNKTIQQLREAGSHHWNEVVALATKELDNRIQNVLGETIDPVIKELISGIDFTKCAGKKMPLKEYINAHLRQHKITQSQFDSLQKKWEEAAIPKDFDELLPEEKTLQEIPIFQQIMEEGQAHLLADVAGITSKKCEQLLQAGWRVKDTDFRVLEGLQQDKLLSRKQVTDLQHTMELNALFDEQIPLVKALKAEPVPGSTSKLKSLKDLVPLRAKDWEKVIAKTTITPPQDLTLEAYAKVLEKRVEKAFPSAVLLDRFVPAKVSSLKNDFAVLSYVLQQAPDVLKTKDWDSLDLTGMTTAEVKKIKTAYSNSLKQLNRYHGLDIHRMSDTDGNLEVHLKNTERKIQLLDTFYKKNADKDILSFDLRPEADLAAQEIDFTGIKVEDQTLLLRHIKTDQRLYALTKDIDQAMLLKEHGFYSSNQIQGVSLPTLSRTLELPINSLQYTYENTLRTQLKSESWIAKNIGLKDDFKNFAIGGLGYVAPNEKGDIVDLENEILRKYDGYQDFFGNLDYCNCKHCNSIFSPAAYFVDLMAWLEKMVLNDTFDTEELKKHSLHLQNRRPDLWYLDLSCNNTHDRLPYLDLINEVLENYIFYIQKSSNEYETEFYEKTPFQLIQHIQKERNNFTKNLYQEIYQDSKVLGKVYSIKAPFSLPLEEVKIYLQHFPITLEEIALTLDVKDENQIARARLGLSNAEYNLLIKAAPYKKIGTLKALQYLFRYEIIQLGKQISLDVKDVLKDLDITRSQLTNLVNTLFVGKTNLSESIEVKSIKEREPKRPDGTEPPKPIQNNAEKLFVNVTIIRAENHSLDRIHRFVRLSKKVPWSFEELDLVIYQTGLPNEITKEKLYALGKVQHLCQRFDIAVDEACVLFQQFPEWKDQNNFFQQLFDQKFNQLPFTDLTPYPRKDFTFIHPVFEGSNKESSEELPRILSGLGVNDEELYQLINKDSPLFEPLGSGDKFILSLENLSLLYRHARLATYLKLSIPQLFQLIKLQEEITTDFIANGSLEDLEKLVTFYDWWKTTEYSIDDLAFIKGQPILDAKYLTSEKLTEELFNRIEKDNPLVFADTVFSYLDGVTEEQSRQIILSNFEYIIKSERKNTFKIKFPSRITKEEEKQVIEDFIRKIGGNLPITPNYFFEKAKTNPQELAVTMTASISSELFFLNLELFEVVVKPTEDLIQKATTKAYRIKETVDVSSFEGLDQFKNQGAPAITKPLLKELGFTENEISEIINTKLEELPYENQYVLSPNYDETSLKIPAHIPVTQKQVATALQMYRANYLLAFYLGQQLDISIEKTKALTQLSDINLSDAVYTQEALGLENDPKEIKRWVHQIYKLAVLFKSKEYTETSLRKLQDLLTPLALKSGITIQNQIAQINSLRSFIQEETLDELQRVLTYGFNKANQQFKDGKDAEGNVYEVYPELSTLLGVELTPVKLVNEEGDLGTESIVALTQLAKRIELSQYLGVGGNVLGHLLSEHYEDLAIARNALLSAFRLKYQDTKDWEAQIQPFQDQIRGIKRDALTDYLINGLDRVPTAEGLQKRFPNKRELYKHFLIDTELEGCATTSRIVAATSSVQLFVQRVLLNLEVSEDFELKIEPHQSMQAQFTEQWEWRKNYRVWEANRKVFLYPENYIEPELRDNKTELFKELEEELLQREINADTVEDAYKKYMVGFEEVNNLQVAGAYHEKEIDGEGDNIRPESSIDSIHLFAVTPGDENQLYYRKIENTYLSGLDDVRINWNSWEKVNLKLPVKKVSPIVFNGRLYVFWNEITTKPEFSNKTNQNNFFGYNHSIEMKFSLKKNKSWLLAKSIVHKKPVNFNIEINNEDLLNVEVLEKNITLFDKLYLYNNGILKKIESEINKTKEFLSLTLETTIFNKRHYNFEISLYNKNDRLTEYIISESTNNYTRLSLKNIPISIQISEIIEKINGERSLSTIVNETFEASELYFDNDWHVIKFLEQLSFEASELFTFPRIQKGHGIYKKINSIIKKFTTWRIEHTDQENLQIISYKESLNLKIPSKAFHPILDKSELVHKEFKSNYLLDNYLTNKPFLAKQSNELYVSTIDPININGYIKNDEPILINLLPTSITYNENCWIINSQEYINTKIKHFTNRNRAFNLENIFRNGISYQQKKASIINNIKNPYNDILVNSDYHNAELILENINECLYFYEKARSSSIFLIQLIDKKIHFNLSNDLRNILNSSIQSEVIINSENSDLEEIYGINNDYERISKLSLQSSSGVYFWELFLHIPFLIANHLNSQQKYQEAQQWYHYIFNPNAKPADEHDTNYVWQFRGFNEHTIKSVREQLEDPASISVYENDPFNPHAIARNRISAYQKTVVMKYIDNLLDWGDQLFAQDTMESINEATMLYILAYEILGERPVSIGDCGEKKGVKTYQQLKQSSSFGKNGTTPTLIEEVEYIYNKPLSPIFNIQNNSNTYFLNSNFGNNFQSLNTVTNSYTLEELQPQQPNWKEALQGTFVTTPIFCIPKNKDLIAYWDRVEDRLFKIRNCMNIKGMKRELALFAPEIDPRLLVMATVQGLSVQEALESLSGNLPPYRFPYLMAKAKEYVGLVQSFGGALQGALERKDVEQLSQLQATHQRNISNMSQFIRDRELEAAESSLEVIVKRKESLNNKKEYYSSLINIGLSHFESKESALRIEGNELKFQSQVLFTAAGISDAIIKIVGMSNSTGGNEVAGTLRSIGQVLSVLGNLKHDEASGVRISGNYNRREQNWKFQLKSTEDELNVIEEQIKGANISKAIAERNYEIFEQSIAQQEEVFDFIKNKFSNLGLYTWLSSQLTRMYREAWNSAYTMAKMAERAYRFERSDDHSPLLNGGYWDNSHHGLLAGQKLLIDLQNLERRYIETHHRRLEVDQSFSLMQIDPQALLDLKQKGECNFSVPELFFDLSYPGQYKRRMRSARLTIPCIVGPYVNVGATLTLTGSRIRIEPNLETSLKEMPPTRTTTIATSTAQNDSGVFEFSFRDERYMPFEGAGAISDWNIKLPNSFRPFDYNTINDVILHISYEADYDGVLAEKVEDKSSKFQKSIIGVLKEDGLSRLFSLRQEFSDSFHKLLYKESVDAPFEISKKHFPIFVQSHNLVLSAELKIIIITDLKEIDDAIERTVVLNDGEIILSKEATAIESSIILLGKLTTDVTAFRLIDKHYLDISKVGIKKEHIKDVLIYFEYKYDNSNP